MRERIGVEGLDVVDHRVEQADAGEIRSLMDDALERLPHRYRATLVLCDLEGQTHEQAAAKLRCPVGTIKSRLSRGRERLRSQLVRRGLAISAALSASSNLSEAAPALPAELMNRKMRAATQLATGRAVAAGVLSVQATALMEGVIRSMFVSKLQISAAAVLAVALTVAGVRTFVSRPQAQAAPAAQDANATGRETKAAPGEAAEKAPRPAEPGTERFQLENGLTVILRPIRDAKTTALIVLYSIGSDHDPEGRSGLAHAVEHLYMTAAAGPEKARTAEEFARRYSDGANGQTGDRYTVFATVFPGKDLDQELADAAARMGSLRVTAADLERERPRLLEEVANMFGAFPALAALNNARSWPGRRHEEDDTGDLRRNFEPSRKRKSRHIGSATTSPETPSWCWRVPWMRLRLARRSPHNLPNSRRAEDLRTRRARPAGARSRPRTGLPVR